MPVTLNFVNADIEGVARAMGAILKQQFVVDPRVRGTITLYSEQPLSPREAYLSFLAALRGLGFAVVEVGGLLQGRARGRRQAADRHRLGRRGLAPRRPGHHADLQAVATRTPNNLVPVLRPLISPNNTINANPGNNSLVITDYADNLQRLGKIIAAMDTPSARRRRGHPAAARGGRRHGAAGAAADATAGASAGAPGVPGGARRRRCWSTRAATR